MNDNDTITRDVTRSNVSAHQGVVQIESNRLLPWVMLTAILAGVSVGLSAVMTYVQATAYRELERENRLTQLQVDNMKVALLAAGVDPAPHLKGEAP